MGQGSSTADLAAVIEAAAASGHGLATLREHLKAARRTPRVVPTPVDRLAPTTARTGGVALLALFFLAAL